MMGDLSWKRNMQHGPFGEPWSKNHPLYVVCRSDHPKHGSHRRCHHHQIKEALSNLFAPVPLVLLFFIQLSAMPYFFYSTWLRYKVKDLQLQYVSFHGWPLNRWFRKKQEIQGTWPFYGLWSVSHVRKADESIHLTKRWPCYWMIRRKFKEHVLL